MVAPLAAASWSAAQETGKPSSAEADVARALRRLNPLWNQPFPAQRARVVQLLVERVEVREDALEVRIRAEGLARLVAELRQESEKIAA